MIYLIRLISPSFLVKIMYYTRLTGLTRSIGHPQHLSVQSLSVSLT